MRGRKSEQEGRKKSRMWRFKRERGEQEKCKHCKKGEKGAEMREAGEKLVKR